MNLAFNNLQWLVCYKTQRNNERNIQSNYSLENINECVRAYIFRSIHNHEKSPYVKEKCRNF